MIAETLGSRLKRSRVLSDLTQKEVDEHLGLRKGSVFDFERDRISVPYKALIGLSELYKCSLTFLLGVEQKKICKVTQVKRLINEMTDVERMVIEDILNPPMTKQQKRKLLKDLVEELI